MRDMSFLSNLLSYYGLTGHVEPDGTMHLTRFGRLLRYVRARSPRWFAGTAAVALSVVTLCLPSAYSTEWPGPTRDVLGTVDTGEGNGTSQMIGVTGVATHKDSGRLLLVTISANGVPGYPLTNAEVIWSWLDPQRVVTPREAVVPAGQSTDEYQKETKREMSSSQDNAVKAAKRFLKAKGVDVSGMKVEMHVDGIGGPSAGMMYTLGLIDKITPQNETGGRTIAGTGTIDAKGKVGAIGGIRLKMIAAKRDGAAWFLAPKSNCDEVVGHVPDGLRDVSVSTIDEAYAALVAIGEGKGESLPHCVVK
ncbi:PDZ/DHR/GLGF domain containing protein [Bifidobacterium stellenboschense]|uniref:endopeptidase La n=2 Tax=Bifidobacterium stellenboschense TaxID=762211 RepID=A0A087D7R5_9BIFI|nr:PDZ/DHR/GLGF domain containing protein [Bifidobacterium stellenboschense]